jgi:predicted Co/Zn/Cd cation transporter (cation efflux family)
LNITNFQFAFTINFVILRHLVLHLLGYVFWLILLCGYCNNIRKILKGGELFLTKNRST